MNKIDTNKIKKDFVSRVDAKKAWFDRIASLTTGTATELTDLNFLCENFLTSVYVEFECLISDLFHGYINNDPKTYLSFIEAAIKSSIGDRYSTWHADHIRFNPPKHINSNQLRTLLDPKNWNITFNNTTELKNRAKDWLIPDHEANFSAISASDLALIDAAHALRNCIAHNSKSSRKVMNTKIKSISSGAACPNDELKITANSINNIGKYLRASTKAGMRAAVYAERIKAIGASL